MVLEDEVVIVEAVDASCGDDGNGGAGMCVMTVMVEERKRSAL